MTQAQVAHRAGVSAETYRKYENGDRVPSRASLDRILDVLAVPQSSARAIRRELGFASSESLFTSETDPDYLYTIPQMGTFGRLHPWPQFGVNNLLEIVTANPAAEAFWGIDFEAEVARRSRPRLNFLAILAERQAIRRIVNWEQALTLLVATLKAIPASRSLLDAPSPLFAEAFAAFAATDPTAIPMLFDLWERTPPATAKVRWNYAITWREPGFDDISFICVVTTASEPDALAFNDWVPADAASHAMMERVIAARGTDGIAEQRKPGASSAARTTDPRMPNGPRRPVPGRG